MQPEVLLPTQSSLLIDRRLPFIHRDLSWLQFNDRVLHEARASANPILERVKFLAITSSNLDEFFMIRFSSLNRSVQTARRQDPKREASLIRIRDSVLNEVIKFGKKQSETLENITQELTSKNIFLIRKAQPDSKGFKIGEKIFHDQIFPHLGAPESFSRNQLATLENLQMGIVCDQLWFRVPKTLPPVIMHQDSKSEEIYFFLLDDLLLTHLSLALQLKAAPGIVRITRDADLSVDLGEGDTESIPDKVQSSLKGRDKGKVVRLQWIGATPPILIKQANHSFRFVPLQVQPAPASLCLAGLWTLFQQVPETEQTKNLRYPTFKPFIPEALRTHADIFNQLNQRDYLLHHPYDSFDGFVSFIEEACKDPLVQKIEFTIYRVDTLSPIIRAIKTAAKKKQIKVYIELRARFDELNNLTLTESLKKAGIDVAFGYGKLKLHAKIALITRTENNQTRLYTHLSTGNYNAMTARQYTDLAILTSHAEIGADAQHFFESLSAGKGSGTFKQLVPAPAQLHRRLVKLIEEETEAARGGKKARIVAKVNALVDESLIRKLYEASNAGVQVDLIVRGACSLIPGVKNLSENIRVISLVDRFLEHSRLYYFGESRVIYLSSADWMPRNFFSRLEIAFPILDPVLFRFIEELVIPAYLLDHVKARELTPQGVWKKRTSSSVRPEDRFANSPLSTRKSLSAQTFFEEISAQEYKNTVLSTRGAKPL